MKKLTPALLALMAFPSLATIHMEHFVVDGDVQHSYLGEVRGGPDNDDWFELQTADSGAYEVGVGSPRDDRATVLKFLTATKYPTHASAREWMKNISTYERELITKFINKHWTNPGVSDVAPLWVRFRTSAKWTGANFYGWAPPTETENPAPWHPPQSCVIRVDVGEPVIGASLDDGLKWPVTTTRQCEYNGAVFRTDDVRVMGDTDPDLKLEYVDATALQISWWAVLRPITSVGEISKSLVLRIEWP